MLARAGAADCGTAAGRFRAPARRRMKSSALALRAGRVAAWAAIIVFSGEIAPTPPGQTRGVHPSVPGGAGNERRLPVTTLTTLSILQTSEVSLQSGPKAISCVTAANHRELSGGR